jgi:mannose-6-phosphate isomerase
MTSSQTRDANYWATWFWEDFFGAWLARVQDGDAGVFDALDVVGDPDVDVGKSLLAQARTLFTVSHAALLTGDARLVDAAGLLASFMEKFQKGGGLYRNRVNRDGHPTGNAKDETARSYDLSFVILGLVTWHKLSPNEDVAGLIDECWEALQTQLTDVDTGLLYNDDTGVQSNPAQNPHMHLYEACLQAYRMNEDAIWLTRAADLRKTGLRYFMESQTGSLAEFISRDLHSLEGPDGSRREIGHQCEWAWLLAEEAGLSAQSELNIPGGNLFTFADTFGFAQNGPLTGAVYDAVSSEGMLVEDSFLLWPQTEAIKILSVRHTAGDLDAGSRAQALLCVMFENWFDGHPNFVNQLDAEGRTIWSQALTRLMYHVILAMTEGARAGLWSVRS